MGVGEVGVWAGSVTVLVGASVVVDATVVVDVHAEGVDVDAAVGVDVEMLDLEGPLVHVDLEVVDVEVDADLEVDADTEMEVDVDLEVDKDVWIDVDLEEVECDLGVDVEVVRDGVVGMGGVDAVEVDAVGVDRDGVVEAEVDVDLGVDVVERNVAVDVDLGVHSKRVERNVVVDGLADNVCTARVDPVDVAVGVVVRTTVVVAVQQGGVDVCCTLEGGRSLAEALAVVAFLVATVVLQTPRHVLGVVGRRPFHSTTTNSLLRRRRGYQPFFQVVQCILGVKKNRTGGSTVARLGYNSYE
eukprot:m.206149 g.206149  ORF g.206149 m.206149 type:complete len:300 (+) comp32943_c0_seq1:501-1400(+)